MIFRLRANLALNTDARASRARRLALRWATQISGDFMKHLAVLVLAFFSSSALACDDYASWRKVNKDCSWTNAAEKAAAASSLSTQSPSDVTDFCPSYPHLNAEKRNKFWAGLLSAMARPESNYKPSITYTENFTDGSGKKVISRGLLQISIESANQKRYSCGVKQSEDLHDSSINLACGIKILEAWVVNDQVIASYQKGTSRGGGRYWSVLRKSNNHLPEIMGNTSSLPFCKK